jgi:hypothetical protein
MPGDGSCHPCPRTLSVDLDLRKARLRRKRYLTLPIRKYAACGLADIARPDAFALSAKTESTKFLADLDAARAEAALRDAVALTELLHAALFAELLARLLDLTAGLAVAPIAVVSCRRYAVEDDRDRFTLDLAVRTDIGKSLPFAVLERKSAAGGERGDWMPPPGPRPIRLSKFLWAMET